MATAICLALLTAQEDMRISLVASIGKKLMERWKTPHLSLLKKAIDQSFGIRASGQMALGIMAFGTVAPGRMAIGRVESGWVAHGISAIGGMGNGTMGLGMVAFGNMDMTRMAIVI